jgi:hypothetical protein
MKLFSSKEKTPKIFYPEFENIFQGLMNEGIEITYSGKNEFKASPAYQKIIALPKKDQVSVVLEIVHRLKHFKELSPKKPFSSLNFTREERILRELNTTLLRRKMDFDETTLKLLLDSYLEYTAPQFFDLVFTPMGYIVKQIETYIKNHDLSPSLSKYIQKTLAHDAFKNANYETVFKAINRFEMILQSNSGSTVIRLTDTDVIGGFINDLADNSPDSFKESLNTLLATCLTAKASKPTKKFVATIQSLIGEQGEKDIRRFVHSCLGQLINEDLKPLPQHRYSAIPGLYLNKNNESLAKGLVWSSLKYFDETTIGLLSQLAERCLKKHPGYGAQLCAGLGNACIYVLANCGDFAGTAQLTYLRNKIKHRRTQQSIANALTEVAERMGISPSVLEELAVQDFGMINGVLEESYQDYTAVLSVIGVGKTQLTWRKPDSKMQKAAPAFIKSDEALVARLKNLKNIAKQVQKTLTVQRDRVDRSYVDDRSWSYADFTKYYLGHGLMSYLTQRLIWNFDLGDIVQTGIWRNAQWEDIEGTPIEGINDDSKVTLWHPLQETPERVLAWRKRLEELEIQQPMKQAYREVYILTEAELQTRTYSNRMAAHILKQHQFNALAKGRDWKASLLGAWDSPQVDAPSIHLPAHQINAEYWIQAVEGEDDFNDTGIWHYIATDQVRFFDADNELMNLIDVPEVVFSEVMRDVDLFVGVASVGNDPQWSDSGGRPEYREYWQTYSFGDLTEVAKTRKAVLETLVPRLKIRDKVKIEGKFLHVQGTKHVYKIHIGSGNILMEPNDQYLCIVPNRGKGAKATQDVFLPFEGDAGVSIVLSKAMLLIEDDKITDATILSQIG